MLGPRSRLFPVAALGVGLVAAVVGAARLTRGDEAASPEPAARFHLVDETKGTYGGVGLGDTSKEMMRALGTVRRGGQEAVTPLSQDVGDAAGPTTVGWDDGKAFAFYRYDDAVFILHGGRIGYFEVAGRGARTRRGVGIGDALASARTRYPGATCGETNKGAEWSGWPACTTRVAPERYVWFGGDPIATIAVWERPMADQLS